MSRGIIILFLSAFLLSCSHTKQQSQPQRQLASVSVSAGCAVEMEPLLTSSPPSKIYQLDELSHLELDTQNFEESISKVIDLNREPAMKEQSSIIFGLLKKLHPEEDSSELIARYQRYFTHCP